MVQHTQTIRRLLPTNCLSVFDHFVGLVKQNNASINSAVKNFGISIFCFLFQVCMLYISLKIHQMLDYIQVILSKSSPTRIRPKLCSYFSIILEKQLFRGSNCDGVLFGEGTEYMLATLPK